MISTEKIINMDIWPLVNRSFINYLSSALGRQFSKTEHRDILALRLFYQILHHYVPVLFFSSIYFFPSFFASMLSVACGTARRRSAGINFPVSRQIPYVLFSTRTKAA